MQSAFKLFSGVVILSAIIFISSCSKVCDLGYEGEHCTTEVRTKYLGTFSGQETCGSVTDTFSVATSLVTSDVTKLRFTNINNQGLNALGTVLDNGSMTITSQTFGTGTISGSVSLTNGKLFLSYKIITSGLPDIDCNLVQN